MKNEKKITQEENRQRNKEAFSLASKWIKELYPDEDENQLHFSVYELESAADLYLRAPEPRLPVGVEDLLYLVQADESIRYYYEFVFAYSDVKEAVFNFIREGAFDRLQVFEMPWIEEELTAKLSNITERYIQGLGDYTPATQKDLIETCFAIFDSGYREEITNATDAAIEKNAKVLQLKLELGRLKNVQVASWEEEFSDRFREKLSTPVYDYDAVARTRTKMYEDLAEKVFTQDLRYNRPTFEEVIEIWEKEYQPQAYKHFNSYGEYTAEALRRQSLLGGIRELKENAEELVLYRCEELEYIKTQDGFQIILPDKSVIDRKDLTYLCDELEHEWKAIFSANYSLNSDRSITVQLVYGGRDRTFGPGSPTVYYDQDYVVKEGDYVVNRLPRTSIRYCDEREFTGKCNCNESCEWKETYAWQDPSEPEVQLYEAQLLQT